MPPASHVTEFVEAMVSSAKASVSVILVLVSAALPSNSVHTLTSRAALQLYGYMLRKRGLVTKEGESVRPSRLPLQHCEGW